MANPTNITYETDNLIAGEVRTGNKSATAATYTRGQVLGRITATGVYEAFNSTGTYDVLNETGIPVKSVIIIDSTFAGVSSGTAVLSADILYVNDATDQGLAETAKDAVAGLEEIKGVCAANIVLAASGKLPVYITGSELNSVALKDETGGVLTITAAIIENAQDNGLILKERG